MRKEVVLFILLILLFSLSVEAVEDSNLHVESPEWQDQIIYFIMTDRFNDGNPENNDQGVGVYNPDHADYYSGGDLQGIIEKIDYIKDMGATSIWITPPVANQWWNDAVEVAGYHGYWAYNFKKVDKHYGDLDTYKQLSSLLHRNGMYLIQDIVVNHTGDYFTYENNEYNPDDPGENFKLIKDRPPVSRPTQPPFNMNNYHNPEHKEVDIYHWTPKLTDYQSRHQEKYYQMGDLDDLNTENPRVRKALKESYSYWIKEVGVDGFRIDTVKFVGHDFWNDFVHDQGETPGMLKAAEETGRNDFLMFGEVFEDSDPLEKEGDKKVASYLGTESKPELPAVLNFPLHVTMRRVFGQGKPTQHLGYRLQVFMEEYDNPYITPNFLDNHDTTRFVTKYSKPALKQALMCMFTIPGIPVIYQGTEQDLKEQRGSMFAGGYGSGGEDHFDKSTDMYQYIKELANLRTSNKIFTRGDLKVIADNEFGPGLIAYQRTYQGKTALIILNTADKRILVNDLATDMPAGTKFKTAAQLNVERELTADQEGKITTQLPPRSGLVLLGTKDQKAISDKMKEQITVDTKVVGKTFSDDIKLTGKVKESVTDLKVVIDGELTNAVSAEIKSGGKWEVEIPLSRFNAGTNTHQLTVYAPEQKLTSRTFNVTTRVEKQEDIVKVSDPAGDDCGPEGNYTLPQENSFTSQMDIRQVKAISSGGNLRLELKMGDITTVWNPDNGFDHVLFNIYLDLPGEEEGVDVLPKLNAAAPKDFSWDYLALADGWNNSLYSAEGAGKESYGASVIPTAEIEADKEENIVKFTFPAASFGNPDSLAGTKIYIVTWDFDGAQGNLRYLTPEGGKWQFGGGDGDKDPLIADDTEIITIKESSQEDLVIDTKEEAEQETKEAKEEPEETGEEAKLREKVKKIEEVYLLGTITSWEFNQSTKMKEIDDGVYAMTAVAPEPQSKSWIPEDKNQAFKFGSNGAWPSDNGGPSFMGKEGKLKDDPGMGNIYMKMEEGQRYKITVDFNNLTYSVTKTDEKIKTTPSKDKQKPKVDLEKIKNVYLLGTITAWEFNETSKMNKVKKGIYKLEIKAPQPIKGDWIPEGKNQAFKVGTNGSWPEKGGGPAYIGKNGKLEEATGQGSSYIKLKPGEIYEITVNLKDLTYEIEKK